MNQNQDELCVTHRIRLVPDGTSGKLAYPVCMRVNNQGQLGDARGDDDTLENPLPPQRSSTGSRRVRGERSSLQGARGPRARRMHEEDRLGFEFQGVKRHA